MKAKFLTVGIYLLMLVVTLSFFGMIEFGEARGMWGARKKKDKEEEVDIGVTGMQKQRSQVHNKRTNNSPPSGSRGGGTDSSKGASIVETLNNFADIIESSVENFDESVMKMSAELLKTSSNSASNPALAELLDSDVMKNVEEFLNSPVFQDPDLFKATAKEGINMLRGIFSEIGNLVNQGPEAIKSMIDQSYPGIPSEVKDVLVNVINGDMSGVDALIDQVPGVNDELKTLLKGMVQGNIDQENLMTQVTSMMQHQMKNVVGDFDENIALSRQQLLENPEMAELFGIDADTLNDPDSFAALMKENLNAFQGLMDNENSEPATFKRRSASF